MVNKALAGAATLTFLAVVRPDPAPSMVETALVAVLMYECVRWGIEYVRKINHTQKQKRYISLNLKARDEDGKRWASERFDWPMYEEVAGCGKLRRF